jgi:hypothetical protein
VSSELKSQNGNEYSVFHVVQKMMEDEEEEEENEE